MTGTITQLQRDPGVGTLLGADSKSYTFRRSDVRDVWFHELTEGARPPVPDESAGFAISRAFSYTRHPLGWLSTHRFVKAPVMKVLTRALLIGAALSLAPALHAQSATFDHVEYISGKNGVDKKIHGDLVLEGVQLHFVHAGKPIFTIPLSTITKTSNTVENDPGSYGRKVLWGPSFASRHEEFVYVTTETPTGAEGIVFKVAKKSSPGIIAKIDFAAKQAKTESGR